MSDLPELPEDSPERQVRRRHTTHTADLNRMEQEANMVDMMEAENVAELRANNRWVREHRADEEERRQSHLRDWRGRKQMAWTATIATVIGLAIGVLVDKFKVIVSLLSGHT